MNATDPATDPATTPAADPDWYERQDELSAGMIFRTYHGLVRLDRPVPGDGTKWYVASWWSGWCHDDGTIEPCDLQGEPLSPDDPALRRA